MDLLSVLRDYPGLQSIELAKLSHPLDICATEAMDHDVCQTIMYLGGKIELGEPRYKPKTPDQVIPALTVLRKQKVGELLTRHGEIDVIRRQAFLVRGDYEAHAVTDNLDLGQLIIGYALEPKDMYFQPIAQKMEGYIPHLKNHENLKWLQPIATSYYAKYVAAPNKAQK